MSAWETDDRPVFPCLVCGGEPSISLGPLPHLHEVHYAFGSDALCSTCYESAQGGDPTVVAERAALGNDEVEIVAAVTQVVLAAFDHLVSAVRAAQAAELAHRGRPIIVEPPDDESSCWLTDANLDLDRWFAKHVAGQTLQHAGRPVAVRVYHCAEDGSFYASLEGGLDGALNRRPRSESWWGLATTDIRRRWSDDRWDWALALWTEPEPELDDARFAQLRTTLNAPS